LRPRAGGCNHFGLEPEPVVLQIAVATVALPTDLLELTHTAGDVQHVAPVAAARAEAAWLVGDADAVAAETESCLSFAIDKRRRGWSASSRTGETRGQAAAGATRPGLLDRP
jgi:uncharacterized membrane protein